MTDQERIALVEEHRLDVWYLDETQPRSTSGHLSNFARRLRQR